MNPLMIIIVLALIVAGIWGLAMVLSNPVGQISVLLGVLFLFLLGLKRAGLIDDE